MWRRHLAGVRAVVAFVVFIVTAPSASATGGYDFDADGVRDYVVGYPVIGDGLPVVGHIRVYSGQTRELLYGIHGAVPDDLFGLRAEAAGDVDGDGHDDMIVGAPACSIGGVMAGSVYLFSGADGSLVRAVHGGPREAIGRDVAAVGDVDGDGYADYALSGFGHDGAGVTTGFVRLCSGADGSVLATLTGRPGDSGFGAVVSGLGDLDSDGAVDIGVSSPSAMENGPHGGAVYVFFGDSGPGLAHVDRGAGDADVLLPNYGHGSVQIYASGLFAGKDLNADGVREIVVMSHALDTDDEPVFRYESVDVTGLVVQEGGTAKPGKFGGAVQGDQDGDGDVDIEDVLESLTILGADADATDPFDGDMDRDGDVDMDDLVIVGANLGTYDAVKGVASSDAAVGQSLMAAGIPSIGQLGCEYPGVPWGGIASPSTLYQGSSNVSGHCCAGAGGFGGTWFAPVLPPIGELSDLCGDVPFGEWDEGDNDDDDDEHDPFVRRVGGGDGDDDGPAGPVNPRPRVGVSSEEREDDLPDPDGDSTPSQGDVSPSTHSSQGALVAENRTGHDTRGSNQMTACPVLVSDGFKAERDVDLFVALPGEDFELKRAYNGGRVLERDWFPWTIGRGWGMSADGWIQFKPGYDNGGVTFESIQGDSVEVVAFPLEHSSQFFRSETDPTRFDPMGPGDAFVHESSVTVSGQTVPAWIVESSGEGQTAYFRTPDHPLYSDLDGRILQRRDAFGNAWTFRYVRFEEQQGVLNFPYLSEIFLHGEGYGDAKAVVRFEWGDQSTALDNLVNRRVVRAEVLRPYGGDWIVTRYADYTYSTDGHNGAYLGLAPDFTAVVQVERGELLNAPAERGAASYDPSDALYRTRFTQYRYLGVEGRLSHVFDAEQVESFAGRLSRVTGSVSSEPVREGALFLLESDLADSLPGPGQLSVQDLASKHIVYYPKGAMSLGHNDLGGRVWVEYLQNGCACAPGGAQTVRQTYEYAMKRLLAEPLLAGDELIGSFKDHSLTTITEEVRDPGVSEWRTNKITTHYSFQEFFRRRAVEATDGSGTWIVHQIIVPFVVANRIIDGADLSRETWSYHVFEDHQDVMSYMPTSIASVALDEHGLLDFETDPIEAFTFHDDEGLIEWREYDDLGRLNRHGVRRGAGGDDVVLETVVYPASAPGGRTDLPERIEAQTGNGVETTEYLHLTETVFGSVRGRVTRMGETTARESEPELGPGGVVVTHSSYRPDGLVDWEIDESGAVSEYEYETLTGATRLVVRNSPWLPSGTGLPAQNAYSDGGMLASSSVHDLLGRVLAHEEPDGTVMRYAYGLEPVVADFDETDGAAALVASGVPYLTVTSVPHLVEGAGGAIVAVGPAVKQWASAGLNLLRRSEFLVDGVTLSGAGVASVLDGVTLGEEVGRSVHTYDVAGMLMESHRWHDLDRDAYYTDRYEYDGLGRLSREMHADGRVVETGYDFEGRVKSIREGSESETVLVEERFYDHDVVGGVPRDGVGAGNLTLVRRHVGDGRVRDRVSVYDWRHRTRFSYLSALLGDEIAAAGEYEAFGLDELGRPIERAVVGGGDVSGVIAAVLSDEAMPLGGLRGSVPMLAFERMYYSGRGLLTRTERDINPGTTTDHMLLTRFVYDDAGREVASIAPSGGVTKRRFDGLGRVDEVAQTDGASFRDGIPVEYGVDPAFPYDTIFESVRTVYDDRGLAEAVVTSRRSGDGNGLGSHPIRTSTVTVRDGATRPIASVVYGVDLGDGRDVFVTGGAIIESAPAEVPPRSDGVLVTETRYDAQGRAHETVDPQGRVARMAYDGLGRVIAVIENYMPPTVGELEIVWDEVAGIRTVANRPTLNVDENRVTSTVYDAADREARRVAHLPGIGGDSHQITEFVRDPGAAHLDGLGNGNVTVGPLFEIRYPDPVTGIPGSAAGDRVTFALNALGEQIATRDQNGTVRTFDRDIAGRMVVDRVSSVEQFGLIDDEVEAIVTEHDSFGRVSRVRSATVASDGTPSVTSVNELSYAYTPLGQIASLSQVASPSSSPMTVGIEWDTRWEAAGNEDRRLAVTYPSGVRVGSSYGDLGLHDDLTDRVRGLTFTDPSDGLGARPLVDYEYMGLSSVAVASYASSGVRMDRRVGGDGTVTQGEYPGWDRFGRLKLHSWVRGGHGPHGVVADVPSEPALVRDGYVYDANSNRLSKTDARAGARTGNTDWRFAYDGLDRLVEADRGKEDVDAGGPFEPAAGGRAWTLDALGNWSRVQTDGDGDGLFVGVDDLDETRVHNMTNEFEVAGRLAGDGAVADEASIQREHDANGNLLEVLWRDSAGEIVRGWKFTYDAWNRLVVVETRHQEFWVEVARHEYNGLHWRVRELLDTSALVDGAIPDGILERERLFAYTPEWQLVYESVDDDRWGTHSAERSVEYFWGLRALDDSVGRREVDLATGEESWAFTLTDGLFSVVAEVDEGGSLLRRLSYDSYGKATQHWPLDLDRDGDVDGDDSAVMSVASGVVGDETYNADADLAMPFGVIDQEDVDAFASAYAHQSVVPIELSDFGRLTVGYAGYHGDELTGFWHARFRWFDPEAGRWLTRDPAGYIDGLSLYLYVGANPLGFIDPLGLRGIGGYLNDFAAGARFVIDSIPSSPAAYVESASAGAAATQSYVAERAGNIAVAAGTGAVTGGAAGAVTGGVVVPVVGAGPGAAIGATAGAADGAISALLGPADAPLSQSAKEGAAGGALAGTLGPLGAAGAKIVGKGLKQVGKLVGGADEANAVRQVGETSVDGAQLHRPYIRNSTREAVENASDRASDGRYIDPNTRRPIDGKPDLGHRPGQEYRRHKHHAEKEGLDQKEFNDRMNNPDLYQLEDPSSNRSRKFESKAPLDVPPEKCK